MEKISVIIPMYNSENTIVVCVQSVLNQTYKEGVDIIIVNDGSTDNSKSQVEELIENNKTNIKIRLINKENGGVSSARNEGLKVASGNWIALLDSDDRWLSNKLERQVETLRENLEIDFLGCSRNNEKLFIFGREIKKLHRASVKELLMKMYPQTSTAIFRRNLFEKYGGYNESMTHSEDGHLWVRFCGHSKFYYMPDSLVITGDGKPSFGHSGLSANLKAMHNGCLLIIREAKENKIISSLEFYLFYVFYNIKYLRRIILTKIR